MRYSSPIFGYILLKLASRCNINCSYCYWFRDKSVYERPAILTLDAEVEFCNKLEAHISRYALDEFTILLHGGEPLLFGKARFSAFMERLGFVAKRTGSTLIYLISTNGLLIDEEWARLFKDFKVHVSISLDGPPEVNDARRVDFSGGGAYDRVVRAISILRAAGLSPGIISVCNPVQDPAIVLKHLVDSLHVSTFDILPPDITHDDLRVPIAAYYTRLFDAWYPEYANRGIRVRILSGFLEGLFSAEPMTDSIGYGPVHTITMLTDGSLEPLDVLRIAGTGSTRTQLHIRTHTFQDVMTDPVWRNAFEASLDLCDVCQRCEYRDACGGGHLAHRWSSKTGYRNPSVYCEDWKAIFDHVWKRVLPEITIELDGRSILLAEAIAAIGAKSGGIKTAILPQ